MTKQQMIREIIKRKEYLFTHDELIRMIKKEIVKYYPYLKGGEKW